MRAEQLLNGEEEDDGRAGADENGDTSTRSVRLYWALHDPTRSQSAAAHLTSAVSVGLAPLLSAHPLSPSSVVSHSDDSTDSSSPVADLSTEQRQFDLACARAELSYGQAVLRRLQERKGRVDRHIRALHGYNEMKDVAQMLMGKLAEMEGGLTRQLYPRFNLDLDD